MKRIIHFLLTPPVTGPSNILIIRWMIATIYIWESILGFTTAPSTAVSGILCSLLLLLGLLTRLTSLYLIIQMTVLAITTSPTPDLTSSLPPDLISALAPNICTNPLTRLGYAQFLTCLYLFVAGPGRYSLDFRISTAGKIYRLN